MIALLSLPSPLHPAVVHFPIVLLLLGAVVAVAAAIIPRWRLPLLAAVLLGLGALGSVVAVQTGEEEGELVNESPALDPILEQHEDWAERTQTVAIIAAVLALGAVGATRWPVVARGLNIVTMLVAVSAAWGVAETGHYGGQLVYRHGAGVNLAPADAVAAGNDLSSAASTRVKSKKDADDDR